MKYLLLFLFCIAYTATDAATPSPSRDNTFQVKPSKPRWKERITQRWLEHRISQLLPAIVPPDTCDVIALRNGSRIIGKITSKTKSGIKYQPCGQQGKPKFLANTRIYEILDLLRWKA